MMDSVYLYVSKFRMIDMFIASTTSDVKEKIIKSFVVRFIHREDSNSKRIC